MSDSTAARPPGHGSALARWADRPAGGDSWALFRLRRLVHLILFAVGEFVGNALSLRAAALTYTVLLAMVPILAMSTALVKGLGGDDHLRQAAYGYLQTLGIEGAAALPVTGKANEAGQPSPPDLGGHLRTAVDQLFAYVDQTDFATLGSFGVAGILLSVILVLGNIEEAMNAIWKVGGGRPPLRRLADYLTILVLLPISVNLTFAAGALLQNPALLSRLEAALPVAALQPYLLKLVPLGLTTLTFFVMYVFFPNTRVKKLPALLGALLAASLWSLTQNVYLSLQLGVANYNTIYGSFATLPLFLVWLYLGWLFILGGAQVAYAVQHQDAHRLTAGPNEPAQKLAAAFAIHDAVAAAHRDGRRLLTEDLAAVLPESQYELVDEVAGGLLRAGVIHRSSGDGRLLPCSNDTALCYQAAALAILGNVEAGTPGEGRSRQVLDAALAASASLGRKGPQPSP